MSLKNIRLRTLVASVSVFVVFVSTASTQTTDRNIYVFHGQVDKVNIEVGTSLVDGEGIPGWMAAMTKVHSHPVDQLPPDAYLETIRGGPDVMFEGLMPKPGLYRAWTQVRYHDKVHTFVNTFEVVDIAKAKPR